MEVEMADQSGNVERISLDKDKPPSAADVFYDDSNVEQDLSGFSLSPTRKPQALVDGEDSILPSTSSSKRNEPTLNGDSSEKKEDSLNEDSRLSMSKESGGIFSWMSRGASSGVSFASENEEKA